MHTALLNNPGARGLAVRKTATSLASTGLVTFREHVAKEAIATGICWWYGGSGEHPPGYKYSNGSFMAVGGMDKSEKIMSSDYDLIYAQEATELTPTDWEACTTRLRNGVMTTQQLIADCNPSHPKHWLKLRQGAGHLSMLFSTHEENPRLFDQHTTAEGVTYTLTEQGTAYMRKLNNLTGVRKLRLRDGLWASAEGVIYEDWDESLHLIPRTRTLSDGTVIDVIRPEWTRFWVVDFGYTHPFVMQCWAQDDDGRLYLYREIFMTGRLVEEHAKQMLREVTRPTGKTDRAGKAIVLEQDAEGLGPLADIDAGLREWVEPEPWVIICDHDAEGRATLEKYLGRNTEAATKAVTEGIERVQMRMKTAEDGRPRLFFLHDSLVEKDQILAEKLHPTTTVEEIPGYVWDESDGPGKKERPVKYQDDGCDCVRYVVAGADLGPGPISVRW
jgi:phage terminase large subunit